MQRSVLFLPLVTFPFWNVGAFTKHVFVPSRRIVMPQSIAENERYWSPQHRHVPQSPVPTSRATNTPLTLRAKKIPDEEGGNKEEQGSMFAPTLMLLLPVASLVFPALLELARTLPANSSEQFAVVTALFVTNRAYLYTMAATIVGLAAIRGANDRPQLGQRIVDLTEELLYRPNLDSFLSKDDTAESERGDDSPFFIQSLTDSGVAESLDQVSGGTQALILPLLVSFLLALSVFLLPFWSGIPEMLGGSESDAPSSLENIISQILPTISQLWNVGLLALFTKAELRRLSKEFHLDLDVVALEWAVAILVTGLACYVQLWPVQNFVNMALAILVARAIQFDSFLAIVAAMTLLTVYDATSVFLIPAAGATVETLIATNHYFLEPTGTPQAFEATSTMMAAVPEAANSAMGSVAIQKLSSASFQPGLLVTKIGNRLGGSLGLGDAVFPSLLATFLRRFDVAQEKDTSGHQRRLSLFRASLFGFLLGCTACEFAPMISTKGLPALVFIVPLMLGLVVAAAVVAGELQELVDFDPKKKTE